jgi:hypothetical protein
MTSREQVLMPPVVLQVKQPCPLAGIQTPNTYASGAGTS